MPQVPTQTVPRRSRRIDLGDDHPPVNPQAEALGNGTINVDETTQPISDKVLDRAVTIDMSQVDLEGFFAALVRRHTNLAAPVDAARDLLLTVNALLLPHGLGFAYRVAEEFVRYVRFAEASGLGTTADVLDDQLVQKILVRLRGSERQRDLLARLETMFTPAAAHPGYPRALSVIHRLRDELDEFGSFQNSR